MTLNPLSTDMAKGKSAGFMCKDLHSHVKYLTQALIKTAFMTVSGFICPPSLFNYCWCYKY